MSPLEFFIDSKMFALSSFEFEGMVKIQAKADVEEKVLRSLGWTKLNFLNKRRARIEIWFRDTEESEIQMYYEFGIFSTIYGGEDMPNWITNRSMGPSISFTIPSPPNKFRGLNFCCVLTSGFMDQLLDLPVIIINNITKNLIWIYQHYLDIIYLGDKCFTLLSHWIFGMNEMECGDHVTVTVPIPYLYVDQVTKECGVGFVYENGSKDEEEDDLGYYKSWNHIIGGDLTGFQFKTGEYTLHTRRFMDHGNEVDQYFHELVDGACYKG
ncbi:unnamed protein product [Lactuca saligna]|uniref:Uncharacterized protein n=1 Tax=Lactuca saligna TaxID=75948 RepID=A0AA35Y6X6_LACSI|nr:unnamed protein product [Lactuca saligna]